MRWDTPVSAGQIAMLELKDGEYGLHVEIETESHLQFRFEFGPDRPGSACPAYRNILEEYRCSLWSHLDRTSQRCGNTFIVVNSPWVAELGASEPLIRAHCGVLTHYVIATGDDVLEVLSEREPKVVRLGKENDGQV